MFNNEVNKKAQLIATLHGISLLDCKKMFRKEQIWFTDKDENGTDLYSLKEFSYAENGVRDTSNIQEKYIKGEFGAIPEPDLISTLLEVVCIINNNSNMSDIEIKQKINAYKKKFKEIEEGKEKIHKELQDSEELEKQKNLEIEECQKKLEELRDVESEYAARAAEWDVEVEKMLQKQEFG